MKKMFLLLCSLWASMSIFAGELTVGYEKITDISSLQFGDKVILYCDDENVGVSGFNGTKDATISSNSQDWVHYEVLLTTNGILLYDLYAGLYIIQPESNAFLYGTANPMICNVTGDGVFGGIDGTTQRYLCSNYDPAHGTFYRFYTSTSSTATSMKNPFYLYKIQNVIGNFSYLDLYETEITTSPSNIWQVAQEGWNGGDIIVPAGYYRQIGSLKNLTAYVGDGGAGWTVHTSSGDFSGADGVTYDSDYIQGGTNGHTGSLVHEETTISAHLKLCPTANGTVYVAGIFDAAKPIWAAKVPNLIAENNASLNYADMTPYLISGFSDMTNEVYASGGCTIQLEVEDGYTYFCWVAGSKIKICGLHTVWEGDESSTENYSITYTISGTNPNTAEVTGYIGEPTDIVIAEEVTIDNENYVVTGIGNSAFRYCSTLTSVTLPNSITSIGDYAFSACANLSDISFPNTLTHIGEGAFWQCNGLTSVVIPKNVATMGIGTFWECSNLTTVVWNARNCASDNWVDVRDDGTYVTAPFGGTVINSITFGDKVETIPTALCWGSKISGITIPNSVTSIGRWAFYDCSDLTSVVIPENVATMGIAAFWGCSNLTTVVWNARNCASDNWVDIRDDGTYIYSPFSGGGTAVNSFAFGDNVETIPTALCFGAKISEVTIPNSVTSIGMAAFDKCDILESATIGNAVQVIGEAAFKHCSSLTSITIPESVTSIEEEAFGGCTSLTSVYWNAKHYDTSESSLYGPFNSIAPQITSFVFGDKVELLSDYLCHNMIQLTSVSIPNSVKTIGKNAFSGCYAITSVVIPDSVTSIGEFAFCECDALVSATIGKSVTSIGNRAFIYCPHITSLTIPNSVTDIGAEAFSFCYGLTSLTIPNSVTNIGSDAFSFCYGLSSIVVEDGNTIYDSRNGCNALIETATNTLITGCKNTIIPNGITGIGDRAFAACKQLTSIDMPESITTIGAETFLGCQLTSITIPKNVTRVGDYAFAECEQLSKIRSLATLPPRIYYEGELVAGGARIVDDYDKVVLYVPCESLATYYTHANWGQFLHIQCIDDEESNAIDGARMSEEQSHGAEKKLQNGQIVIINNGKTYNILGNELK